MSNLLGEGFPIEIIEQINQRQKIYGSGYAEGSNRSSDNIVFLNSNTSWCKLVSSVNITDQQILQNQTLTNLKDIDGNKLANKFILFNGTINQEGNLREGIDYNNTILSNKAYGIGGNNYGIKPMMGIQSVDVKHENRGSLRRAKVKIKAWNREQFEIIDILYLRLGFSMLLEWGHSMYYNNKGELQTKNDTSLSDFFISGKIKDKNNNSKTLTYDAFLKYIDARRIQSFGNYDAMFAKVNNFHFSFQPDGSYDIQLDLVSVGDVIESFKINSLTPNSSTNTSPTGSSSVDINDLIDLYANKSNIGQYLYRMKKSMKTHYVPEWYSETIKSVKFFDYNIDASIYQLAKNTINGSLDGFYVNSAESSQGEQYYTRLGNFLEFLQKHVLYQIKSSNTSTPLLKFDTDTNTNLIYVDKLQQSIDPTICVINKPLNIRNKIYEFYPFADKFLSEINSPSKSDYGKIMNIYVNFKFILNKIDELKDDKNSLSLIDFLKGILDGINGALGGINSLDIFIDETNNTVKIIDKNPLPDTDSIINYVNSLSGSNKLNDNYATFNLYGYNSSNNTSGFIKGFEFKTELSPALSTMITVGAVSNSSVVGENSTALSRLNVGLTDRFKEKLVDSLSTDNNSINEVKKYNDIFSQMSKQYIGLYTPFVNYLIELSRGKFTLEQIKTYKDGLTNLIRYKQQYDKAFIHNSLIKQGKKPENESLLQPSTGFIPFNLSLTMDGLSGMKINSKFLVESSYLPSNYPKSVDFLIKNLSHEIKDNKWNVTLESYCISKGSFKNNNENDINPRGQAGFYPSNYINLTQVQTDNNPSVILDNEFKQGQITINQLVSRLHPNVQSIFTQFFTDVLNNLPGYNILINETLRTFSESADLKKKNSSNASPGYSPHNYGYAIDLNLFNRKTGVVLRKNSPQGDWLSTGFVDIAKKYGISWGNFSSYMDLVHFYVDFNRNITLNNVKQIYPEFIDGDLSTSKNIDGTKVNVV